MVPFSPPHMADDIPLLFVVPCIRKFGWQALSLSLIEPFKSHNDMSTVNIPPTTIVHAAYTVRATATTTTPLSTEWVTRLWFVTGHCSSRI